MSNTWDWSLTPLDNQHADRLALMREVEFECTSLIETEAPSGLGTGVELRKRGKALSLNISPGGMLLLMDWSPVPEQVLRVHVPAAVPAVKTPTLAEVRWVRDVPFSRQQDLYFVGVRFLF